MSEWWNNLGTLSQVLFIIAMSSTIIFAIQLVMLLVGIGFDDADFDSGDLTDINDGGFFDIFGLRIVTIRGVLSFLSIGSWTALVVIEASNIEWLGIILGILAGAFAMFVVAFVMHKVLALQEDGNINNNNAIGKKGTVYLTVPKSKSGNGKVNVFIQERLVEVDAVTDDEEDIPTGSEVTIIANVNNTLVVTRKGE